VIRYRTLKDFLGQLLLFGQHGDQIRNRNDPSTFPNWHFVDYPLIAPSFPDRGSPTPQDDILFGNDQGETI
jgi:hypothetical protein